MAVMRLKGIGMRLGNNVLCGLDMNDLCFLDLLSASVRNKAFLAPDGFSPDWEMLYKRAKTHDVHTLIYPILQCLDKSIALPEKLSAVWRSEVFYTAACQESAIDGINDVLSAFNEDNIPVIPFKGIVLRELYPYPELRTMGDIDILVKPTDLERAGAVLTKLGYFEDKRDYRVVSYVHSKYKHLELHNYLLYPKGNPQYEAFENGVWSHITYGEVSGIKATLLNPTYSLLQTILHYHIHYSAGGIGLRQLCDILLLVEKYKSNIDWQLFWEMIKSMNAGPFTVMLFEICGVYLNLDIKNETLTDNSFAPNKYAAEFMHEILENGTFGRSCAVNSIEKSLIVNANVSGSQKKPFRLALFSGFAGLLFPSASNMHIRYAYAQKFPFLLPTAWIHRLLHAVFSHNHTALIYMKNLFSLTFSKKRLDYLKFIGLI